MTLLIPVEYDEMIHGGYGDASSFLWQHHRGGFVGIGQQAGILVVFTTICLSQKAAVPCFSPRGLDGRRHRRS